MILTVILFVILADILTKYLVVQLLVPLERSVVVIPRVLDFTFVKNTGAAFGILSDYRWVFMTISVIFIVVLSIVLVKSNIKNKLFNISVAMILGGGIANMIDRIFLGYVVDFIEFTFVDFAVFNVADSCITVGAVLALVYFVFFDKENFTSSKKQVACDDKPSDE